VEGLSDDAQVQLLRGIAAGERLVADARKPIAPGTRVRAIPVGESAAQGGAAR
jgi:hypothetical protein